MSKHTPGPWIVSRGANVKPFSVEAATSTIADIYRAKGHGTCEANARLIAAAPELLEACREAKKLLEEVAEMNIQPFPISAVALNRKLIALVAKAGE